MRRWSWYPMACISVQCGRFIICLDPAEKYLPSMREFSILLTIPRSLVDTEGIQRSENRVFKKMKGSKAQY